MSQENVDVVRRVYEAAARRDAETVLDLYDPEVEFDVSRIAARAISGKDVYRGHDGLRSFFREWYAPWDEVDEHPDELIDAGEYVISVDTPRGRGRASGAEVELHRAGLWTVRDGRIVRVDWFPTRAKALEAVGLGK